MKSANRHVSVKMVDHVMIMETVFVPMVIRGHIVQRSVTACTGARTVLKNVSATMGGSVTQKLEFVSVQWVMAERIVRRNVIQGFMEETVALAVHANIRVRVTIAVQSELYYVTVLGLVTMEITVTTEIVQ